MGRNGRWKVGFTRVGRGVGGGLQMKHEFQRHAGRHVFGNRENRVHRIGIEGAIVKGHRVATIEELGEAAHANIDAVKTIFGAVWRVSMAHAVERRTGGRRIKRGNAMDASGIRTRWPTSAY